MLKHVPSLVTIAQQVLARNLDAISDVGEVPYSLLKEPLSKATPKQLYRIERANPHLMPGSDELWLQHCLTFLDLREAYERGEHRDPRCWRALYLKRFAESERKRKLAAAKIKEQYNKIESQKAARSIKVLTGKVPLPRRRGASSSESGRSRLFQETKKAADRTRAMYQRIPPRAPAVTKPTIPPSSSSPSSQQPISPLQRRQTTLPPKSTTATKSSPQPPQRSMSYPSPPVPPPPKPTASRYSNDKPLPSIYAPRRPLPHSNICSPNSKRRKLDTPSAAQQHPVSRTTATPVSSQQTDEADSSPNTKKPMAKVNYNIFKELS